MSPQLIRVTGALAAALLVAAMLKFMLLDLGAAAATDASFFSTFARALAYAIGYGLTLGALAVAATEAGRYRHIAVHLGLGALLALTAAYLSTRGQDLTAPVYSGGGLTSLFVLLIGVLSSLTYWAIAGRQAGWRGDEAEQADTMAEEAFRTASASAQVDYCRECIVGWAALGLLLFGIVGWGSVYMTGLRERLMADAEFQGRTVLKTAGFLWATFNVEGAHGIITGQAPDEAQKGAAYDAVRETLQSVTGFPGILSQIDNNAVAHLPMAAVSQRLADAAQRESEAKAAVEAARVATEAARTAEADTKRKLDEQARFAEEEIKRRLEEQARLAEVEIRRRLEEQARAVEKQAKAAEERARVAEEAARQKTEQQSAAQKLIEQQKAQIEKAEEEKAAQLKAEEEKAATDAAAAVEVALAEPGTEAESAAGLDAAPAVGEETSAPAAEASSPTPSGACTAQDLAIVESSRIHFHLQTFDVPEAYEQELDRLAASAKACAPRPIMVSGHADSMADSLFNRALGLQRAQAVRQGLIDRGVPETLVISTTAGTSAPLDSSSSSEAQAINRRAEFRFLEASEVSRDATLDPEERATTCESELSDIMSQSVIYFSTASSRVGEDNVPLVKKLAKAIGTCGSVIVTVEGHTDKIGDDGYNQGLSESRANAVREALVAAGADPTRLASRGFAASRPQDPDNTAEAFALNRRIEFRVSGKFSSTNTGGP